MKVYAVFKCKGHEPGALISIHSTHERALCFRWHMSNEYEDIKWGDGRRFFFSIRSFELNSNYPGEYQGDVVRDEGTKE